MLIGGALPHACFAFYNNACLTESKHYRIGCVHIHRRQPVAETKKGPNRSEIAAQGGRARAAVLGQKKRSEQAKNAALSRWSGAVHHALEEAPLELVGMTFRCAVLEDETRVISG